MKPFNRCSPLATLSAAMLVAIALVGCSQEPDPVLGTLERDRISLPAPASERIARIAVREGQSVAAGDTLMELESTRIAAQSDAALAEQRRAEAALAEARHGPLPATIAQSRARLAGSEGVARNARQQFARTQAVVARQLLPVAELDQARAARDAADADVDAAREALRLLQQGTRSEQIAQAEAAVEAARAQVQRLAVDLERTRIATPRAGRVETLPFKTGDQPAIGATLATLMVGERVYARVYVPQSLRLGVAIGTRARVFPQGSASGYEGRVRAIRSDAAFTPYYALAGRDVSRLSWLAEIELGPDADALPVGIPVRAQFTPTAAPAPAPPQ